MRKLHLVLRCNTGNRWAVETMEYAGGDTALRTGFEDLPKSSLT
jgi:hypothetical protein